MGRYSTPIAGMIARLKYQADKRFTDRLLSGATIIKAPIKETKGTVDMPCVMFFVPDFQENFAPAKNIDGKIEVKIWIMTARIHGLEDGLAVVERVLDSLQRDPATGLQVAIPGTARHFDCKLENAYAKSVFFHFPISIFLQPVKHEVGYRSDKVVAPPTPPEPVTLPLKDVFGSEIEGVGGDTVGAVS
jgi:hypothetical protein